MRLLLYFAILTLNIGQLSGSSRDTTEVPIVIHGKEISLLDLSLPDGGLLPLPGVANYQIFRSSRDVPALSDGDGWTYAHHMDLAIWKGKMVAAWNMTLKDEDRPPSKVVFATSTDGINWSKPADLFPREWAWACRFYFYQSGNNRMLAFCAAKIADGNISEDKKSTLLVREIKANYQLGEVFTLINPRQGLPSGFETSADQGFITACREAISCNILLEQQDYGVFLGDRKMEWHDKTAPYKGFYKFGKALCFYHRADGKLVGMSKMGFVTLSGDEGKSWSAPTLPPTLTAGAAKVWGQKTNDNRYILAYNPDPKKGKRFPLALVRGEDGIHFDSMRIIHGEFSPIRYPGLYKDLGYQYVRGVPEWSNDHSLRDSLAAWLIYSVNKEDIWVSRIPLTVAQEPSLFPDDDFENKPIGQVVSGWNIYSPAWAPVAIIKEPGRPANRCLELRDGDPADHAQAQRIFPETISITADFNILPGQTRSYLEISLETPAGKSEAKILLDTNGTVKLFTESGESPLGGYQAGKWLKIHLSTDAAHHRISARLNGKPAMSAESGWNNPSSLQRIAFRTGPRFGITSLSGLSEGADRPLKDTTLFLIDKVKVMPLLVK